MSSLHLPIVADSFELYLAEINRFSLLDRHREYELACRWRREGDMEAAHRLVCANLRFVVKIAFQYRAYGIRLLDLIQEGNIGLMMAVKKFDPDRGIRLISYAVWWIRAYIQNFVIRSWSLVKIGTTQTQKKLFFKLGQARSVLQRETGEADSAELARQLAVSDREVEEMALRMAGRDASLELELTDGNGFTLLDSLADSRENQEDLLVKAEEERNLSDHVRTAMDHLNVRERKIISDRILRDEPRTLQELADDYGISRERVRQLEKNALKKLKGSLAETGRTC